MQYRNLGQSGLNVSQYCLGTMTWGMRTTQAEGHAQIDAALGAGINFIDTAELYPTYPMLAENIGKTEEIIGNWFAKTGRRSDVVLASKIAGEGQRYVRDGAPITAEGIKIAVEGSLRRLQTDHIDLYQLHWPNRGSYHFRKHWTFDPTQQNRAEIERDMLEVLGEIQNQIDAGRIGHFGLSNESAWGTAKWLSLADQNGLPRPISIQNEYSLLCRSYDTDLAELSHNENIDLLAFSPLAGGLLSGKYAPDVTPENSRRAASADIGGRITPNVWPAIDAYADIANRHGLDLIQMALAFCASRPFMGSVIFGASSLAQLDKILNGLDLTLSDDVNKEIGAVFRAHGLPF